MRSHTTQPTSFKVIRAWKLSRFTRKRERQDGWRRAHTDAQHTQAIKRSDRPMRLGSRFWPVRPTKLDKIENFHIEVCPRPVTRSLDTSPSVKCPLHAETVDSAIQTGRLPMFRSQPCSSQRQGSVEMCLRSSYV